MTSTPVTTRPVTPLKVATASLIGTAIEWYDYFIYGMAAAVVFGPLFFPTFSSLAGTLAAFATFSVGFLARPLGGIVMGHFGDRVGRKSMLVISLLMMGLATAGIGLLPTYATIGVWAPILLVILRFVQGFGVGGEWGGAVLMAVEHAPAHRRSFYGSFPQMGVPAGLILANLAFVAASTIGPEQFAVWGWRVPFLASAVLVAAGLVIRFTLPESPQFEQVQRRERRPVVAALRRNPREILLTAAAFLGINAVGYIFMAYLLSHTTKVLGMNRGLVITLTLIGSLVWLITIPWASARADRGGRRRVLTIGSIGLIAAAVTLFPLVDTAQPLLVLLALMVTGLFMGLVYGPMAALFAELFSPEVRYSGASLGYQLGSIAGGGLAPTVAAALFATWGSTTPITLYLGAVTALSFGAITALLRDRS